MFPLMFLETGECEEMWRNSVLEGQYFEFGMDMTIHTICLLGKILLEKKKKKGYTGICWALLSAGETRLGCVCRVAERVRSYFELCLSPFVQH